MRIYPFAWGLLAVSLTVAACIQTTVTNGPDPTRSTSSIAATSPAPNHAPVIKSLTAHRFAQDRVTLWLDAADPDCDPLNVSWSTTQGILSSTVGLNVDLTMGATSSTPTLATVLVNVSDGQGGSAQGSLNIQFGTDGMPTMTQEATASQPTPEPCSTPTPTPKPTSQPAGDNPAQPSAIMVSGRAYYPGGPYADDAISGAGFVFVSDTNSTEYFTQTDGSGRYSISIPPGSYSVWGERMMLAESVVIRVTPAGFDDVFPSHPAGYDADLYNHRMSRNFQSNTTFDVMYH